MPRSFNGSTSNYISCNPFTGNFSTIVAWVKLRSLPGAIQAIAGCWQTGDRSSLLQVSAAGKLQFLIISAALGGQAVTGATTLSLNTWMHLCGRYTAGNVQDCWIDGVQDGTRSGTGATLTSGSEFLIGRRTDSGTFTLDALVGDVAWWSRGLLDQEIVALAAGMSPSRIPFDLLGHVPLWGFDSPELDLRQGVGATIVGTVPASTDFPFVGSPWSADG